MATRWTALESARGYLDKITEELIEPNQLLTNGNGFLQAIDGAYQAYRTALFRENRVDFAHLQRLVPPTASSPFLTAVVV